MNYDFKTDCDSNNNCNSNAKNSSEIDLDNLTFEFISEINDKLYEDLSNIANICNKFDNVKNTFFIDNEDCFNPAAEDLVHKFVPMFGTLGYVGDVKDDVSVLEGPLHHLHHRLVKLVIGFQNTRRIGIDDLEVVAVDDTQNPVARGLRLRRDDRQLFADQCVHECRFADVGIPDDIYKTRFVHS